jgi:hypothetical protein
MSYRQNVRNHLVGLTVEEIWGMWKDQRDIVRRAYPAAAHVIARLAYIREYLSEAMAEEEE